jgi:hypothetical protein
MAKNWNAYEAAKELYGTNKENIEEIGSRYPLFARTVAMDNSPFLLDLLSAIPKVTARVVETGLKTNQDDIVDAEEEEEEEVTEAQAEKSETKKASAKKAKEEPDESVEDYESMSAKDLYALCCKRGISSMCKSRKKDALIELLEKLDNGEIEPAKKKATAKAEPKKATKPANKEEPEEAEDEEESDPYAGKPAKELYKMCVDRGIKTQPKQKPEKYAELLKKADAEAKEADSEDWEDEEAEEDDDEWEI